MKWRVCKLSFGRSCQKMSGPYYLRQFKTTVLLPEINPSNYKWRDIPMIPTYILRVELFWTKTSTWHYLFETNLKYKGNNGFSLPAWYSRVFAVVKFVSCQFVYRFLECCNLRFRSFWKKKWKLMFVSFWNISDGAICRAITMEWKMKFFYSTSK